MYIKNTTTNQVLVREDNPYLNVIPHSLMEDPTLFNREISDRVLSAISKPTEDILQHLQEQGLDKACDKEKIRCLLGVASNHPSLSFDDIASALKISSQDAFLCAVALGHFTYIKAFFIKIEWYKSINGRLCLNDDAFFNLLRLAAEHTSIDIAEYLMAAVSLPGTDKAPFFWAVKEGRLPLLNYLISQWSKEDLRKMLVENADLFYQVASNGHLPILKCLVEALPSQDVETMVAHKKYLAFRSAASCCYVNIMAYLISLLNPEQVKKMLLEDCHRVFERASHMGHLPVLKSLIQHLPEDVIKNDLLKAFRYAVIVKDHSIIAYLLRIPMVLDYAKQNFFHERYIQAFVAAQSVLLKTWGVFPAPVNAAITEIEAALRHGAEDAGKCSIS